MGDIPRCECNSGFSEKDFVERKEVFRCCRWMEGFVDSLTIEFFALWGWSFFLARFARYERNQVHDTHSMLLHQNFGESSDGHGKNVFAIAY